MSDNSSYDDPNFGQTTFSKKEIQVTLLGVNGKVINKFSFTKKFTVGRANDNDIVIIEGDISRYHLKVTQKGSEWWLSDLKSANGVYIYNERIEKNTRLIFPASILLGRLGISLDIQVINHPFKRVRPRRGLIKKEPPVIIIKNKKINSPKKRSKEEIKKRLLDLQEADDASDHTIMLRKIISEDRKHKSKGYKKTIWTLAFLFIFTVGLVGYQQFALSNANKIAIDMFYDIKSFDVDISKAEIDLEQNKQLLVDALTAIEAVKDETEQKKLKEKRDRLQLALKKMAEEKMRLHEKRLKLAKMRVKYRSYVKEANSLRIRFPSASRYEDELIAKVAREMGESELELPAGFMSEVRKYIRRWQSSNRMDKAMLHLEKMGYTPTIIQVLQEQGLQEHFFFLPLQESNYNHKAIGPTTRWGIAKGAWQFIPPTARGFGLKLGSRTKERVYDPADERFNFKKAARAGAKYLKYIYGTKAQASGLLVIASYNYGEPRIIKNLRKMPKNPRERNFWKYIQRFRLPKETYSYVYYIFAAAVIGQDPQHFGFKFKSPVKYRKVEEIKEEEIKIKEE